MGKGLFARRRLRFTAGLSHVLRPKQLTGRKLWKDNPSNSVFG
jgi:hypothetical protein